MIPKKHSPLWGGMLAAYAAIVFIILFFSQNILQRELTSKTIISFVILAVVSAVIACLGGFLGARKYFLLSVIGAAFGLIYMLYIALFNVSPGWGDLTSIVGYLMFAFSGVVIGIVTEAMFFFVKINKK